ncbi:MAG TPA: hypothetical protein VF311_01265 [Terriglobales bacterium]
MTISSGSPGCNSGRGGPLLIERQRDWYADLRRPSDSDREQRIVHAATPLLAAAVS